MANDPGLESLVSKSLITIKAARAPSTRKLYSNYWNLFRSFCRTHDKVYLPATTHTVLAFLQSYAEKSNSASACHFISASITAFHDTQGYPSPCNAKVVKLFLLGIKKTLSKPVIRKTPISHDILVHILNHCLDTDLYSPYPTRPLPLWREAIFELLAFLCMARFDDLARVLTSNITILPDKIVIFFPHRKNDQLKSGHYSYIQITNSHLCPKKIYLTYLVRLSSALGLPYIGPLLPKFIKQGNNHLVTTATATYSSIRSTQFLVLKAIGLDASQFGCHSSRRGSVKTAKAKGHTSSEVSVAGGWSANSVIPDNYDDDHKPRILTSVSNSLSL
ncbi:uncharacterized protein LOC131892025 isoform X2 [Tigriopus californicus]|uniref:uncharacterized protein LOC131892025 isoform X2 n=1 Tax=Tigriopus californicus TaxID=6832 RepID=UPI0027DA5C1E|nr:uncharacterized protein LOC131892025 isoform X2 [Tigriopus californicus]